MEDFYQQFKDNLENRAEPSFEEEDWQLFEEKLDGANPKKRRRLLGWWWLLPLLLIPLLASNIFFYKELNTAREIITNFQQQSDTFIQSTVVIQRDTIYEEVIVRREVIEYTAKPVSRSANLNIRPFEYSLFTSNQQQNFYSDNGSEYASDKQLAETSLTFNNNRYKSLSSLLWQQKQEHSVFNPTQQQSLPELKEEISLLDQWNWPLLDRGPFELPLSDFMDTPIWKEEKSSGLLPALKPSGFRVGAHAGTIRPYREGLENRNGTNLGLEGLIKFNDRLGMWIGISQLDFSHKSTVIDEALGVPPIASPGDDYIFQYAKFDQGAYQFSVGMQYELALKEKWLPFFGIGYGATSFSSYEVYYEYLHQVNGQEIKLEQKVAASAFESNLLHFKAGLGRKLGTHWIASIRGNYRRQLGNNDKATMVHGISLLGGLQYEF